MRLRVGGEAEKSRPTIVSNNLNRLTSSRRTSHIVREMWGTGSVRSKPYPTHLSVWAGGKRRLSLHKLRVLSWCHLSNSKRSRRSWMKSWELNSKCKNSKVISSSHHKIWSSQCIQVAVTSFSMQVSKGRWCRGIIMSSIVRVISTTMMGMVVKRKHNPSKWCTDWLTQFWVHFYTYYWLSNQFLLTNLILKQFHY